MAKEKARNETLLFVVFNEFLFAAIIFNKCIKYLQHKRNSEKNIKPY